MYINGKHDGIIFVFLTVKNPLSIAKIKTEEPVHTVQTLCMKEGIIIATVNYRYAKIGPCCTKRHRPSLVWTISNSSRPTCGILIRSYCNGCLSMPNP
jgi:hypothetical protein